MNRSALIWVGLITSLTMLTCGSPPSLGAGLTHSAEEVAATIGVLVATSVGEGAPTDTPLPATPTPLVASATPPEVSAPSLLPVSNTGIILAEGECYDLDTGNAPYVMGPQCDVLLVYPKILRPQNGAMLSGHATLEAPSLSQCESAIFEPGDLAPNTDMYICFRTNEGRYGFLVQRADGAPFEISNLRLVFDWWVYR